ncbi:Modification methylase NgoFVII [Diplodia seriata]|nr:Modification methylase NgoFVII [Diplodia seriata]
MNEINTDALFAIGPIIRAAEPRLVTLEETFGLLTHEKHTQWFGILLSVIYEEGYSIRWAIQNTLEYGISQPRRRLALIAAAPGFPLPKMPKPTHGKPGSGLPSFVTVREAIGTIPRGTTNHNPMSARRVDKIPWDPDHPYNKTIKTSNSEVYHWSGRRKFTNRELAGLQGFPHTHTFHGSSIEKQIGNAVPSTWFKLVFDECVKVLRRMDRAQGRSARSAHGDNENGREETGLFGIPSQTMSPAPRNLSQVSKGSSAEDAIVIDDDEVILVD